MRQRVTLPFVKNLILRRQADFSLRWTMKDANNVAINNASYVFKMQLRKHAGETIVKEFTTAGGDFIHGGSNGRMQLYIDVSDIAEIPVGVYEYDIRETDPLGEIRYLFAGKATVVLMVTET